MAFDVAPGDLVAMVPSFESIGVQLVIATKFKRNFCYIFVVPRFEWLPDNWVDRIYTEGCVAQ